MEENKKLVVNGFVFASEEDAKLARMELKTIDFLEKRIDFKEIGTVLKIYNKAIEEHYFKTPVGYYYLKKLRNILVESKSENIIIRDIPLYHIFNDKHKVLKPKREIVKNEKKMPDKKAQYLKNSIILNIGLIILALAMVYITITSENPNMINYRTAIINQYAEWEEELNEREAKIREREKEILIQQ
ncbi:MAG: hypothetical protein ACRC7V_09865 [Lachnospiraceae bacterium]